MTESQLQQRCISYCKEHNILVINIHGGGWTAHGCPDLLLCIRGQFVAIELKVEKNQPSLAQKIWRARILKAGGRHFFLNTLEDFISTIEKLREQA